MEHEPMGSWGRGCLLPAAADARRVLYRGLLGARGHGADALPTTPDPRAMLRARVWCLSGLRLPRPSCPLGRRRRVSSSTLRAREKDPLRILVARGRAWRAARGHAAPGPR